MSAAKRNILVNVLCRIEGGDTAGFIWMRRGSVSKILGC